MTNRILSLILALTIALSLFSATVWATEEDFPADGSDSSISVVEENPITVSLSENTLTLFTGKTATLKATVQPKGEHTVQWSSDNKKVATVDSMGKVTAKGEGNCTITATVDDVTAACVVTVKKPTIKLNKSSLSLDVKKTATLKATVDGPSKTVTWKSSNTKIATVDKNGKVTAKKVGSCTITATANGVSAKCTVKVLSQKDKAIEAYKKFLSQDNITWDGDSYPASAFSFELIYIDNDPIPELYMANGQAYQMVGYTALFAWKGGKVKRIVDGRADGISYYRNKGIYDIGYAHQGWNEYYYKYSKGSSKMFLSHGEYLGADGHESYFSHIPKQYTEITKKQFNSKLKAAVGSTKKSTPKAHKNTKANRDKYLK